MNKCLTLFLILSGGMLLLTAASDYGLWQNPYLQKVPLMSSLLKELEDLTYGLNTHERIQQEVQAIASDLEQGNCKLTAQIHDLFHLQQKHKTCLQEFGIPVFQSSAEFLELCVTKARYPVEQLPDEIRKAPELIALAEQKLQLRWTSFASDYSTIVFRIDRSREERFPSKDRLLVLREKLQTLRDSSRVPAQGELMGACFSEVCGTEVSRPLEHYNLLIDAVTSLAEGDSPTDQNLTHAVLRAMNRRFPDNSLRSKRDLLHLFELVTRE